MDKRIEFYIENGTYNVAVYGYSKYPKFYFFQYEQDALNWVKVLEERYKDK